MYYMVYRVSHMDWHKMFSELETCQIWQVSSSKHMATAHSDALLLKQSMRNTPCRISRIISSSDFGVCVGVYFLPSINTRCQKWLWNHSQISWASSFEDVSLGRDLQLLMQHYSTISQTWLFHQTKIWWQANEYQRGPWK